MFRKRLAKKGEFGIRRGEWDLEAVNWMSGKGEACQGSNTNRSRPHLTLIDIVFLSWPKRPRK